MDKKHLLIVEDSKDVVELVEMYQPENYILHSAFDGEQGLSLFKKINPDLLILDLLLPKKSGYEVLKEIRNQSDLPVIILSAKSLEHEIILGLNKGADDYLTKPFSPLELVARINALVRRTEKSLKNDIVKIGDMEIDTDSCVVKKNDEIIELTGKEYSILKYFMQNPGKVFTKTQLLEEIWGGTMYDENTIPVYIGRIREKIEDNPSEPNKILNIRGLGYKFNEK